MAGAPLSDIVVLDFSRARAGPWCTQIMSELGAEIIKIEQPGVGDLTRAGSPDVNGTGVNFITRNRNKKSVTVNLKSDEGVALVEDLIAEADVLIENFSLGVMDRFGLGYEAVKEINPSIIYASIKGYGEKGPYKDHKGVDFVLQADAGLMSINGPEGGPPVKVGQGIIDIGTGLYSLIGILTALYKREQTGDGEKFETNLFGTTVSFLEEYLTNYGISGEDPVPGGNKHQSVVPHELFETKDGHLVLFVHNKGWETFVTEIIGDDSLLRFDTQQLRRENYDEIMSKIRPVMRERPTQEWEERLREIGVPSAPLNRISDVVEHPQARARDYVFEFEDDHVGKVLLHGHPLHFASFEREIRSGPPRLGEHTDEVLAEYLDLPEDELDRLRADDVIA